MRHLHLPIDIVDDFADAPFALLVALHLERYSDGQWRKIQQLIDVFDRLQIQGFSRRESYRKLRKMELLKCLHGGRRCCNERWFKYRGLEMIYCSAADRLKLHELRSFVYGLK